MHQLFYKTIVMNVALTTCLSLLSAPLNETTALRYNVSFNHSLSEGYLSYFNHLINNTLRSMSMASAPHTGRELLNFLNTLYDKNNLYERFLAEKNVPHTSPRIPKIIHQIWLGSPFPEKYKTWQTTWLEHHPDWTYMLWTDENSKDFPMYNRELFDKVKNFGEKADILRYELLYKFGGLYIDVDFACLENFDVLHDYYDFYTGVQPLDCGVLSTANGLIGSIPEHPILKDCITTLRNDQHYPEVFMRTGPVHFTKSFMRCAGTGSTIDIAFPTSFFYPLGLSHHKKIERRPETFAVHFWAGSWK